MKRKSIYLSQTTFPVHYLWKCLQQAVLPSGRRTVSEEGSFSLWAVTWQRPPSAEKPPHFHLSQKPGRAHTVSAVCLRKRVCVSCHIKVRRSGEAQVGRQISSHCWAALRGFACLCGKAKCCRLRPMWNLFLYLVHWLHLRHPRQRSTCLHLHVISKRTGVLVTLHTDSFCVFWCDEGGNRSHTNERAGVMMWLTREKANSTQWYRNTEQSRAEQSRHKAFSGSVHRLNDTSDNSNPAAVCAGLIPAAHITWKPLSLHYVWGAPENKSPVFVT